MLEATSGFLATRAIAGGGQNRPADCLQCHLAASAYLGEVFLLFLVHCDRPFLGPVYEVILALVRNGLQTSSLVPARSVSPSTTDMARLHRNVGFVPNPDIALERKSRPKAALNLNLMIVDQAAINAGLDFRR